MISVTGLGKNVLLLLGEGQTSVIFFFSISSKRKNIDFSF